MPAHLHGAEPNDPEAGPDLEVWPGFRHAGGRTPPPDHWTCPTASGPTIGHVPRTQPRVHMSRHHAHPHKSEPSTCPAPERAMDIAPTCPLPGTTTGHVPRRQAQPLDMSHGPSPECTCPAHAHPHKVQAQHMPSPGASNGHNANLPIPSPTTGHVPGPPTTGHVPWRQAAISVFMLFFIDKPTRTQIKSNNSTSCDGSHGSGQGRIRRTIAPGNGKANARTDAVRNGG